jgi:hypothetical protein
VASTVVAGWCARSAVQLAAQPAAQSAAPPAAQGLVRVVRNQPGESKALDVTADEVATWTEAGKRILLLKGNVWVEMGIVNARFSQGVIWVDLDRLKTTRIMPATVYGEGDVKVENGPQARSGPKALMDLNTRGQLVLKVRKKTVQQALPGDELYRRAMAESEAAAKPAPAGNPKTEIRNPSTPAPSSPIQRTVFEQGVPGPAVPPVAPVPGLPPGVAPPSPPTLQPPVPGVPVGPSSPPSPPVTPGPPPVMPPASGPPPANAPPPRTVQATPPKPAAPAPLRQFSIEPRRAGGFQLQRYVQDNGEEVMIITGGIILTVRGLDRIELLDMEADRLVVWTRGDVQQFLNKARAPDGATSREVEFFLAGNVEIRSKQGKDERRLIADEVYYDVGRNVAVALTADLIFRQPGMIDDIHLQADELHQLGPDNFEALQTTIFSSHTPGDPGLKVVMSHATLEHKRIPKKNILGRPVLDRKTGQPEDRPQDLVRGNNVFLELEDVPVFYLPIFQGDAEDPLGPIQGFGAGFNQIFGAQISTTLNVYNLLGIDPLPGTRWRMDVDYLSKRGPALGTEFDDGGNDLFGIPSKYAGLFKAYGIHDSGTDNLGGGRGPGDDHPEWRGRILFRENVFDLPYGFTVQTQVAALSDKNFLEQYFKVEFDSDINQETFLYVKQQQNDWAWILLAEPRIRNWVTESQSLPRADGYLIGQSLFDLLTYNAHASAGFFQFLPTNVPPPPVMTTQQARVNTGRFDLWQELSLPFYLGPVKFRPYAVVDLTDYTDDLTGQNTGRTYGGGGLMASMPLTRIYPGVQSTLFNLNGINHKIVLTANYYNAQSSEPFTRFPQLDPLEDDATEQAINDITPRQPGINPQNGLALSTLGQPDSLFNPQRYAIRQLVTNRIDTLDDIDVLQLDIRQRLQTKRGYPGQQHIVDWMVLDLSGSIFPEPNRDNFGQTLGFLQYDWLWNIGDRTALASSGWIDATDQNTDEFTIGAYLNRPDRTNFYLGYRQIDPIQSKAVTAAVTYVFSPKYATSLSSTYDFGTGQALSNSVVLTRMGSDLQVSLGFTYNVLQNNFGFVFQIEPNILAQLSKHPGMPAFGSNMLGR